MVYRQVRRKSLLFQSILKDRLAPNPASKPPAASKVVGVGEINQARGMKSLGNLKKRLISFGFDGFFFVINIEPTGHDVISKPHTPHPASSSLQKGGGGWKVISDLMLSHQKISDIILIYRQVRRIASFSVNFKGQTGFLI